VVQEPACAPTECSAPVIVSFNSVPNYVQQYNPSTLSWTVSNATSVSIYPTVGTVASSGSYVVSPNFTTTYTLTATNSYGSVTASTTVTVSPAVTTTYISPNYNTTSTYNTTSSPATGTANGVVTSGPSSGNNPFSNLWLMSLLLIGLVAIAAVATILIITRRRTPAPAAAAAGTVAASRSTAVATMPATGTATRTSSISPALKAKFVSDKGDTILLPGNGLIGRNNFQSVLTSDRSDLISRQHLRVDYENGQYYIEDSTSTNGTKLNGKDIRGTGRQAIDNDDVVDLAGVISLTFKT